MAESMYRQIAEDLQRRIESGELAPGAQLPTEIELQGLYESSRHTIKDATRWLLLRGLVHSRPGVGVFVSEKIIPFVTTLSSEPATGRGGGEEGVCTDEISVSYRFCAVSRPA